MTGDKCDQSGSNAAKGFARRAGAIFDKIDIGQGQSVVRTGLDETISLVGTVVGAKVAPPMCRRVSTE